MNKACASILIFAALFALVGAEDFMRLPLEQGTLRMRNLASSSAQSYSFSNYSNNFGVRVNLSSTYLTGAGLDNNTQTGMLLYLYSNVTAFCQDCGGQFVFFDCDFSNSNKCGADTTQIQTFTGPNHIIAGHPFNFSNLTIGTDNTTAAWKLNTTALLYKNWDSSTYSIWSPTDATSKIGSNYFKNTSAYGFIGLGVGGNASKNFQTTTPIFSVKVNSAGNGSLIFGKDTTLIDSSKTPISLTTDTNWAMASRNMSWGSTINSTSFYSSVIFDLQSPGVLLPLNFRPIWAVFYAKYNLVENTTLGNSDFPMTYNGSLSSLPDLTFGLTNDKNITLPPSAYTRQLATNFYAILIGFVSAVKDQTIGSSGDSVNFTVLGWPVLSQFYTIFELPTTGIPTVTMYPTYSAAANSGSTGSSFSLKTLAIVAAVVLVVLVTLSAVCKKKQDFTKSDLGIELRAARV